MALIGVGLFYVIDILYLSGKNKKPVADAPCEFNLALGNKCGRAGNLKRFSIRES